MSKFSSDTEYKGLDFSENELLQEYDNCTFINCTFNNASSVIFEDCTFNACDFSNCKLDNTTFKEAVFQDCKLIGLHFDDCKEFLLFFLLKIVTCNSQHSLAAIFPKQYLRTVT